MRCEVKFKYNIIHTPKNKIIFKTFNLVDDLLPENEKFDLILCRNVMIYFSKIIIEKVAINLARSSNKDSTLFIGHSESLQGTNTPWKVSTASVYLNNKR